MKLHFGTGLMLVFTLWAGGLLYLVFLSMKEEVDLVAGDYYNQELAYQERIDRMKNASGLQQPLLITVDENRNVTLDFPESGNSVSGHIRFVKPDNALLDFTETIATDSAGRQTIASEKFIRGLWKTEVSWSSGYEEFFSEQRIVIN